MAHQLHPEWAALIAKFLEPFATMDPDDPNNVLQNNFIADDDIPDFLPPVLDVEPVTGVHYWKYDYILPVSRHELRGMWLLFWTRYSAEAQVNAFAERPGFFAFLNNTYRGPLELVRDPENNLRSLIVPLHFYVPAGFPMFNRYITTTKWMKEILPLQEVRNFDSDWQPRSYALNVLKRPKRAPKPNMNNSMIRNQMPGRIQHPQLSDVAEDFMYYLGPRKDVNDPAFNEDNWDMGKLAEETEEHVLTEEELRYANWALANRANLDAAPPPPAMRPGEYHCRPQYLGYEYNYRVDVEEAKVPGSSKYMQVDYADPPEDSRRKDFVSRPTPYQSLLKKDKHVTQGKGSPISEDAMNLLDIMYEREVNEEGAYILMQQEREKAGHKKFVDDVSARLLSRSFRPAVLFTGSLKLPRPKDPELKLHPKNKKMRHQSDKQ